MATSFTDCCIRYGQEYVYTTFSDSVMTLGEIYISLTYGLIDPSCLPAMAIIHYDNKIWCTDTRRLTLAKELERRGKYDILKLMDVREVKTNTPQYKDFVHHRLPAMQRKGLDGLDIKVSDRRGPTCCFNNDHRFRLDLEEHVIQEHLHGFTFELFKNLTIYDCNMCRKTTRITCTKSSNRSYYTIIRRCGCKPKKSHQFTQSWSRLTFAEMCNELLRYNDSVKRKVIVPNPTISPNNTKIVYRSTATQTDVVDKCSIGTLTSNDTRDKSTQTLLISQPPANDEIKFLRNTFSEHERQRHYIRNQETLKSDTVNHGLKQKEKNDFISPVPSNRSSATDINTIPIITGRHRPKLDFKTIVNHRNSLRHSHRRNKTSKQLNFHHQVPKACCNIS